MSRFAKSGIGCCLAAVAFAAPHPARAQSSCAGTPQQLVVYHAGSLSGAFKAVEQLFTQQTGTCITDVAAGSLDAARRITTGREPADIFAAADYLDIDLFLKPARFAGYDILFAQGGMVLGYTTGSHAPRRSRRATCRSTRRTAFPTPPPTGTPKLPSPAC